MNINLKNIRKRLNLSQQEFADKLNVTQTLISKIEAGKSKPTLKMLNEISTIFDINLNYILFEEGDMYKANNQEDKAGDNNESNYKTKNKNLSSSDDKWLEVVEKLVSIIEVKDTQIDKMLSAIQQLTQALNR